MFFIVTIVSTVAFMSVGTLASLTSFASQYREMNPLGLVYISESENRLEQVHIEQLLMELQEAELDYDLTKLTVLRQTSSFSGGIVDILRLSDINKLAHAFGYEALQLEKGEALFLPPSTSSYESLNKRTVNTVLEESEVGIKIDGAYPYHLFAANSIGTNAVVLNDEDFGLAFMKGAREGTKVHSYYAFHIPEWQETKDIGLTIDDSITEAILTGTANSLSYSFDNPGLSYSIIRTTFSLLLFINGRCGIARES